MTCNRKIRTNSRQRHVSDLVDGDQTISANGSANQILVTASVGPVREGIGVAEKPNKTDIFGIGGNQRE